MEHGTKDKKVEERESRLRRQQAVHRASVPENIGFQCSGEHGVPVFSVMQHSTLKLNGCSPSAVLYGIDAGEH